MSSAISEVTGTHKWPKHCCFPLRGPAHSLQSLGSTGSSTVPGNRHGPLCVTSDLVPGTVLLHWLCCLWKREKALSSEEVTLPVFQGHMLFSERHYLATLPLSYKEIIWYKLTSPTFPAVIRSFTSQQGQLISHCLITDNRSQLQKWNRQVAKKYSDPNLRRCEIPQLKRLPLPCCAAAAAKRHRCLKMLNLMASSRKQQCNIFVMFFLRSWIGFSGVGAGFFFKGKIKSLGSRCPPRRAFSLPKKEDTAGKTAPYCI